MVYIYRIEIIDSLDCSGGDASLGYMESEITPDTLVPSRLIPEVRATAEEDHRAPNELVGEAVEIYLKNRRWRRLVERGQARARELGLTEADLPRLIAEAWQERRQEH